MKLHLNQTTIAGALAALAKLPGNKTTLPILGCVAIIADDQGVRLTTTDLERFLSIPIEAEVESPGSLCLPVGLLKKLTSRFPADSDLMLEQPDPDRPVARLTCDRSTFDLSGLPIDEFPRLPKPAADSQHFTLGQAKFKELLTLVAFCMSTDESRYMLNGVCLDFKGEAGLDVIATDGRRLSVARYDRDVGCRGTYIVPAALVQDLLRLLGQEGDCTLSMPKGDHIPCITFDIGPARLTGKLIEGTYPNWKQVVPRKKDQRFHAVLEAGPVLAALSRLEVLEDHAHLEFSKAGLLIKVSNREGTQRGEELIPMRCPELTIAFSMACFKELVSFVKGLENSTLEIAGADGVSPIVAEIDALKWTHVLMPKRLDDATQAAPVPVPAAAASPSPAGEGRGEAEQHDSGPAADGTSQPQPAPVHA